MRIVTDKGIEEKGEPEISKKVKTEPEKPQQEIPEEVKSADPLDKLTPFGRSYN